MQNPRKKYTRNMGEKVGRCEAVFAMFLQGRVASLESVEKSDMSIMRMGGRQMGGSAAVAEREVQVQVRKRVDLVSDKNSEVQGEPKPQGKKNAELGKRGEEAAARFLYRRGYEILERNWRCFAGEADIIARDGDSLVFVEVKTRRDCQKGFPAEAVNKQKRSRYEKIALAYLAESEFLEAQLRFDVVSIVVMATDRALIRHHINAFAVA